MRFKYQSVNWKTSKTLIVSILSLYKIASSHRKTKNDHIKELLKV